MKTEQLLQYLDAQAGAIEALIGQLDEIQVVFNAQFDTFKSQHDANLDALTETIAGQPEAISPDLRAAIEARLVEERAQIDQRRQKVRAEYLPQRRQAADETLHQAQAELAGLRALNPQLDEREEAIKADKAGLEAHLAELNEQIRRQSRSFGVVRHFLDITRADRERHRILGKLEAVNESLRQVRREWEQRRTEVEEHQARLQERWQLESIAVARLQSELDQLDDEAHREALALRRAVRHVLDHLKAPSPSPDPEIQAGLRQMVDLNIQTDSYHQGLASVGGLIGLLRGIDSGLQAIRKSVDGIRREHEMHSAYLAAPDFSLSDSVRAFHDQWPALARQFADEKVIGQQPAGFAEAVQPLLEGPLSQPQIEAMFQSLGTTIERATARWG